MMSFYASCMATLHNLDVRTVPIAVVGNFKQRGSVVLAASPPMKKRFRIKTGNRLFEIPSHPEIRLFEPKMAYFLKMSMAITRILHKYVPAEAIHVYSVDESRLLTLLELKSCGVTQHKPSKTYRQKYWKR